MKDPRANKICSSQQLVGAVKNGVLSPHATAAPSSGSVSFLQESSQATQTVSFIEIDAASD